MELVTAQILYEPEDVIQHIHFPTSAFVSLVSTADGHDGPQTGMVGNEGALGYELSFNVQSAPLRALAQGAGKAWRLTAQSFAQELEQNRGAPGAMAFDYAGLRAFRAACADP
ncbi:hypothetical protein J2W30_004669 [Variovorax boronicumulans]|uniref:hypothetical protein n=1 Tax=Variovorax boronicumulans TaxID=436515 RepID=UPI0027898232|nr:hypothetical protein [Variovorax boronicumulans]MDQ0036894.1 hypothetical protein [Variovorax boronicumulans]